MTAIPSGVGHGSHLDLICQITAHGQAGTTDGANQVAPAGEFPNLQGFAESEVPKLITAGAFQIPDLKITTHLGLSEALEAVEFKILDCRVCHLLHCEVIETELQQEKRSMNGFFVSLIL